SLWELLCVLADEYPGPREDAIRHFEEGADDQPGPNELRFLARVRPGSSLLLRKCMKALQIGETKRHTTGREAIAATEILGTQFPRDEEVRRRIVADCTGPWFPHGPLMALCEGWPESPEVDHAYDPRILEGPHDLFSLACAVRLTCLKAPTDE